MLSGVPLLTARLSPVGWTPELRMPPWHFSRRRAGRFRK